MAVLDKSFDVFVMRSGISKRVYLEKCGLKTWRLKKPREKPPFLQLLWPPEAEGEKKAEEEEEEQEEEEEEKRKREKESSPKRSVTQDLHIFSLVRVRLQADEGPLKYNAILLHPTDSMHFVDGAETSESS